MVNANWRQEYKFTLTIRTHLGFKKPQTVPIKLVLLQAAYLTFILSQIGAKATSLKVNLKTALFVLSNYTIA